MHESWRYRTRWRCGGNLTRPVRKTLGDRHAAWKPTVELGRRRTERDVQGCPDGRFWDFQTCSCRVMPDDVCDERAGAGGDIRCTPATPFNFPIEAGRRTCRFIARGCCSLASRNAGSSPRDQCIPLGPQHSMTRKISCSRLSGGDNLKA